MTAKEAKRKEYPYYRIIFCEKGKNDDWGLWIHSKRYCWLRRAYAIKERDRLRRINADCKFEVEECHIFTES